MSAAALSPSGLQSVTLTLPPQRSIHFASLSAPVQTATPPSTQASSDQNSVLSPADNPHLSEALPGAIPPTPTVLAPEPSLPLETAAGLAAVLPLAEVSILHPTSKTENESAPVPEHVPVASSAEKGILRPISKTELESAPVFLRSQLTLEVFSVPL
jgi:hypothetical protein